jgi:hypothetical protein
MANTPDYHRSDVVVATGYVDWPAILAGTVLAVALSFVLLTFGSAIGLSVVSFEPREGASLFWLAVVSGLWFIWVAITSFGAGGYLAGRLRRPAPGASVDEVEVRDGAHGLLVWATGALLGAVLAASGVTGAISAAGRATGTVAQTAAEAIGGDLDYLGERLVRGATGGDPALRQQAVEAIRRGLADGEFSPEDRDYLAGIVAQRTGRTPEEAGAAVDAAFAEAKALYDGAIETAEQARVATAIGAFLIAATLLASGAAAYMAAVAGGDHRDRGVRFGQW